MIQSQATQLTTNTLPKPPAGPHSRNSSSPSSPIRPPDDSVTTSAPTTDQISSHLSFIQPSRTLCTSSSQGLLSPVTHSVQPTPSPVLTTGLVTSRNNDEAEALHLRQPKEPPLLFVQSRRPLVCSSSRPVDLGLQIRQSGRLNSPCAWAGLHAGGRSLYLDESQDPNSPAWGWIKDRRA